MISISVVKLLFKMKEDDLLMFLKASLLVLVHDHSVYNVFTPMGVITPVSAISLRVIRGLKIILLTPLGPSGVTVIAAPWGDPTRIYSWWFFFAYADWG